jgi:hypothetical protein
MSEVISTDSKLNDILGERRWYEDIPNIFLNIYVEFILVSAPVYPDPPPREFLTRHPELRIRLSSHLRGALDTQIIDAVKSLMGFRLAAKDPFANNAPQNLLTCLPNDIKIKVLSHVPTPQNSSVPSSIKVEILFDQMKGGLTYQEAYVHCKRLSGLK